MKRWGILGFALLAVLAAVAVPSASAKTVGVARTAAGVLAPGAAIEGFSSNLIFETTAGNLECEENQLIGSISNNEATKIHGTITKETSKGDFSGIEGACKTSATGPVLIESSDLPWPVEFTTKGTGAVKGSPRVVFDSTFLALEGPSNHCTFEAAKVKDTYKLGTEGHPIPVVEQVTKQTFKHAKKAKNQTSLCPASGVLSGTFTLHAGPGFSEAVESELVKK
jgi:hypothetical protein